MTRRGRRIAGLVAIVAVNLAAFEGLAYLAGGWLLGTGAAGHVAPYDNADLLADYDERMAEQHDTLGWPTRPWLASDSFDSSGARVSPAFPEPGGACVSLYGDSFTYGQDVAPDEAWGDVLSRRLGCRVANYGVGGYGPDQALLRFEVNDRDEAGLVVLGIMPENVVRILNRYRGFVDRRHMRYSFKPRFVLDGEGRLELVPMPRLTREAFAALPEDAARHLPHETFLPVRWRFPYLWSLRHVLTGDNLRAWWHGEAPWMRFYDPEDETGAVALMAAIAGRFVASARARGKRALVLVLPDGQSFRRYAETGVWLHAPLLEAAAARDLPVHDLGPDMLRAAGGGTDAVCALFVGWRHIACVGHYDAAGNRLVAELVAGLIERDGLLSAASGDAPRAAR